MVFKARKNKSKEGYQYTKKINKAVVDELLRIKDKIGLTPSNIVKLAQNKNSVLNPLFDWNNNIAGHKWRLEQARFLIQNVEIIIKGKVYRGFENVKVSINNHYEKQYLTTPEILSRKELRNQVLRYALTQLKAWKDKYEMYKEFAPIILAINKVNKRIK